jgi:hypothetical protein
MKINEIIEMSFKWEIFQCSLFRKETLFTGNPGLFFSLENLPIFGFYD